MLVEAKKDSSHSAYLKLLLKAGNFQCFEVCLWLTFFCNINENAA